MSVLVQSTRYAFRCEQLSFLGQRYWRWMRNDGQVLSPVFDSEKCALEYAKRMPMLTIDEWESMETYPIVGKDKLEIING